MADRSKRNGRDSLSACFCVRPHIHCWRSRKRNALFCCNNRTNYIILSTLCFFLPFLRNPLALLALLLVLLAFLLTNDPFAASFK